MRRKALRRMPRRDQEHLHPCLRDPASISQSDRASNSIVDHLRIVEALEKRDTELAVKLVRQHSLDLTAYVEAHCDFFN